MKLLILATLLCFALCTFASSPSSSRDQFISSILPRIENGAIFTVAADGTGNFTTITAAVNAAPNKSEARTTIYVKTGIYHEYVFIPSWKRKISLIGDGSGKTIITGSRSYVDGWNTSASATLGVRGEGFLARDMTIENTAGPQKQQAVALQINADFTVVYRCTIKGWQDTLYVHAGRQFYRECEIYGTVDFIFGNGRAIIQASRIISRLPLPGQYITITAQSRNSGIPPVTGISIHKCSIEPDEDLKSAGVTVQSFLERPWKSFSTTVVMESYIDGFIAPAGWSPWTRGENKQNGLRTVYYGEYKNNGSGSNTTGRVQAAGFHLMTREDATKFAVSDFIQGEVWLGLVGVPYDLVIS